MRRRVLKRPNSLGSPSEGVKRPKVTERHARVVASGLRHVCLLTILEAHGPLAGLRIDSRNFPSLKNRGGPAIQQIHKQRVMPGPILALAYQAIGSLAASENQSAWVVAEERYIDR